MAVLAVKDVFDNQALNTLFNYGCRCSVTARSFLMQGYKSFPIAGALQIEVECTAAGGSVHVETTFSSPTRLTATR